MALTLTGGTTEFYIMESNHSIRKVDYSVYSRGLIKLIDTCVIAHTKLGEEGSVNTVFLGYDEASLPTWRAARPKKPLLFSTRILNAGPQNKNVWYSSSYAEAELVHKTVVKVFQEHLEKTKNTPKTEKIYTIQERRALTSSGSLEEADEITNVQES